MDKTEDIFMVKGKELKRLEVIRKVLEKVIDQQEAAEVLRLSDRQVRRIVKRVRKEGARGIIHRLRGKPSCHRIDEQLKQKVLGLYGKVYRDFGPTLACEKMEAREGLKVCDETLRLWLIEGGLWQVKRQRGIKKLSWRARKEHYGEMVQMDGSHHDWLEGRGPKLVLMGYVDDATSRVWGRFYEYEGTKPAMDSLRRYIQKQGIPTSIYLDKHSTYKVNKAQRYKDWPFRDKEELTQFARACKQLGIDLIHAHSPQAKGRVERTFGTLQDRLVKEMRLAQVRTLKEANVFLGSYLPRFNRKFNALAKEPGDYHRTPRGFALNEVLSIQTEHALRNDRTMVHDKKWYQILNRTRAQKVTVHEYLNGRIMIHDRHCQLQYKPIDKLPKEKRRYYVRKTRGFNRYQAPRNSIWRTDFKLQGSLK